MQIQTSGSTYIIGQPNCHKNEEMNSDQDSGALRGQLMPGQEIPTAVQCPPDFLMPQIYTGDMWSIVDGPD